MQQLSGDILTSLSTICQALKDSNGQGPVVQKFLDFKVYFDSFLESELFVNGNLITATHVLEYFLKYLKKVEEFLGEVAEGWKKKDREKMSIFLGKLKIIVEAIRPAFELDKDDLACLPEEHERKIALNNVTDTILIEETPELKAQIKLFHLKFDIIKAMVYTTVNYKKSVSRDLLSGWLLIYYGISSKNRKRAARLLDATATVEHLSLIWNLIDSNLLKKIAPATFPSVGYSKMLFLPRLSPSILDTSVKDLENDCNLHYTEILAQEPILAGTKFTFTSDPDHIRIPVRLLSQLPLAKLEGEIKNSLCSSSISFHKYEKLVIHVHGGGYIGMSSFSHQSYTRRWAMSLDAPIFSIDYGLVPSNPYPEGLEDVWQAYTWLVKYSHKFLGITPKRVVLVGDSAGGCFITGITIKAIMSGFRVPDALLMIYPGFNMDSKYYSISMLTSLEDKTLPFGFYHPISKGYLKNTGNVNDIFVSPILCPQNILEKFPETELLIVDNDPLSFDSYRFADKLLQAGVNLHITKYPNVFHGALSLGNKHQVPAFSQIVDETCSLLKKLLF